ncbi:hypothetical protein Sm713_22420 [Streptomyces sp. TS71-3]|nr:hypothetical protein Sm713_22420 [Streptomyces sp. TS71-3]
MAAAAGWAAVVWAAAAAVVSRPSSASAAMGPRRDMPVAGIRRTSVRWGFTGWLGFVERGGAGVARAWLVVRWVVLRA